MLKHLIYIHLQKVNIFIFFISKKKNLDLNHLLKDATEEKAILIDYMSNLNEKINIT